MVGYHKKDKINSLVIKRIKKKDLQGFLEWMEARKEKYYKMAWAYLYNHYDVEDVFQITILKVYENIHQLKEEKYFETWVTSILLNQCKSTLRKKKREVYVESTEDLEGLRGPQEETVQITSRIELEEKLNQLDDLHKEVVVLKYISGYSQEEIGEILNIPVGTVKSRIYRGLKALKQEISREV